MLAAFVRIPHGFFVVLFTALPAIAVTAVCFSSRLRQNDLGGPGLRRVAWVVSLAWIGFWEWRSLYDGAFVVALNLVPVLLLWHLGAKRQ